MNLWNCSGCNQSFSDSSHKNIAANDSYVLIYECNKCSKRNYTVTKNTRDITGATILKALDKEIFDNVQIQEEIKKLIPHL